MTRFAQTRRGLLGSALALGGISLAPGFAFAAPDDQIEATTQSGRSVALSVWRPERVRAAVVFSHGSSSEPQAYEALLGAYRAAGLLVAAPLHVDSYHHPQHDQFDRAQTFRARIEDVGATLRTLSQLAPSAPHAVSGHSYGGLMSLIAGGGLTPTISALPGVRTVVAFSSAGRIPGLITEQSYSALTAPTLMVTGDRDTVQGVVSDWHDHLYPFETSPAGNKLALVYAGAVHNMIGGAQPQGANASDAMANGADFILANAAGDADAAARIAALQSNAMRQVLRR